VYGPRKRPKFAVIVLIFSLVAGYKQEFFQDVPRGAFVAPSSVELTSVTASAPRASSFSDLAGSSSTIAATYCSSTRMPAKRQTGPSDSYKNGVGGEGNAGEANT